MPETAGASPSVILANPDGPEGLASRETAEAVSKIIDVPVLAVQSLSDLEQLAKSRNGFAFLATHGGFAEDGTLQRYLASNQIMFTHSNSDACRVMANKHETKLLFSKISVNTPGWFFDGLWFRTTQSSNSLVEKPIKGGSKIGVRLAANVERRRDILFEEYIEGQFEVSVLVLGVEGAIPLPPIVRRRSKKAIGQLNHADVSLPKACEEYCVDASLLIWRELSARGIIKVDFVIDDTWNAFAIEVDSHPALGTSSAAAQSAALAGISYGMLIQEIVNG